jgi:hypothetical protein
MYPWGFQTGSGKNETKEAYQQFIQFVRLGPLRSLHRLVKQSSIGRSTIYVRAKQFDWIERAKAFDKAHGITKRSTPKQINQAVLSLAPALDGLGIDLNPPEPSPVPAVVNEPAPLAVEVVNPGPTPQPQAQPLATPARRRDHWREIRRQQHMKAIAELRECTIRQGKKQQAFSELLIDTANTQIREMLQQGQVIPPNVLQSFASTAANAAALAKAGYESQTKGLGIDHMMIMLEDAMQDDIAQMAAAEEAMGPVDA